MKSIGIFYGSSSGNTQSAASLIQQAFGTDKSDVIDVAKASADQLSQYSYLVFGTSTWGVGDLQDDWADFISQLNKVDWTGKKVALFGLGDSSSFSDSFVDGMGTIYEALQAKATVVGAVDAGGYSFDSSKAEVNGKFVGLALDEENEGSKTSERIKAWVADLGKEFA